MCAVLCSALILCALRCGVSQALWRVEGFDGQTHSPSHYDSCGTDAVGSGGPSGSAIRRLLPQHPYKLRGGGSRLIEKWPDYLERLNPSSSIARTTDGIGSSDIMSAGGLVGHGASGLSGSGVPERMQICYESSSAAGRGKGCDCGRGSAWGLGMWVSFGVRTGLSVRVEFSSID